MKAVIQRVTDAKLYADGEFVSSISNGLVVFVGVEQGDNESSVDVFAQKLVAMRIFSDPDGKMNLSARDINADLLIVSNFTLCADISHGNRPSFSGAMRPVSRAKELYDYSVSAVRRLMEGYDSKVCCGVFGADMQITRTDDGPVTIIYA